MKIKRSQAANIINDIRQICYNSKGLNAITTEKLILMIEERMQRDGIQPYTKCTGEAHSNGFIDHCGICMPNWEMVGGNVKVS